MANKKTVFEGAATALITPFADGLIDFESFDRIIDRQIDAGISALVVAGTTGEAPALSYDEHSLLFKRAVSRVGGKIPVIAGCGSNSTANSVKLAKLAREAGADALLAVTPYYNKATPDGLIRHYTEIADSTDLPLILYNVPSRTGLNLTPEICIRLSEHPNIVAVKEASGNIAACAEILSGCAEGFALYSGNDDMTVPVLSLGGLGIISVLSNIHPEAVVEMCRLYMYGNPGAATRLQLHYMKLIKALFAQVNPVPVKCAMAAMGFCREEYRLPLCPPTEKEKNTLIGVLRQYGLL